MYRYIIKDISFIDVLFIDMYIYASPARTDARLASDRVQLPRFRLRLFHPDKYLYVYTCIYNSFMLHTYVHVNIHTYSQCIDLGPFIPINTYICICVHLYTYMCTYNSYMFAHISTCIHI